MKLSVRMLGLIATIVVTAPMAAEACHTCKKNPCVIQVQPAYRCEIEMVPYTVTKTRMRMDFRSEICTVMTMEPVTTMVTQTCTVLKPVTQTDYVTRHYTVNRPVYETTMTTRTETVCRPVTTTRTVTECIMQPSTYVEAVATKSHAGCGLGLLCGKLRGGHCGGGGGCHYVTKTCYTAVPVSRQVVVTTMVPETRTVSVPVTTCRIVCEQKMESVPVTTTRLVPTSQTMQVPVTNFRCVPKTITRQVPICVPETYTVTCYRPVKRMVPVCQPAYGPVASGPIYGPSAQVAGPIYGPSAQAAVAAIPALQGPPPVPQK